MSFTEDSCYPSKYQELFVSIRNQGSGSLPLQHQCLICSYKSYHRTTMKRHVKVHTGERPFKCAVCGKRFIQNADLKKHVVSQHIVSQYIMQKS